MVEIKTKKTLSQQVESNKESIESIKKDMSRCPIQMQTIQFYADEMESNRKSFNDLQKMVFPMSDELKALDKDVKKVMAQQEETLKLTKELIARFKEVMNHV